MPIQVTPTDSANTLRLDFTTPWDWIDYQFAISICAQEIKARPHPVDLLVVMAPNLGLPPGAFVQFRYSLKNLPANLGTICVVLERESVASLFMAAFVKTCPDLCRNLILVHSLDEARRMLAAQVPVPQLV